MQIFHVTADGGCSYHLGLIGWRSIFSFQYDDQVSNALTVRVDLSAEINKS